MDGEDTHQVTGPGGGRLHSTRLHIIEAAAREFASKPYGLVNLDDILEHADVTKGAMYTHFRSKYALAKAIIEHRTDLAEVAVGQIRSEASLERLIDISYLIAVADVSDDMARAGFNLLESIGRFDGYQAKVIEAWTNGFARLVREAIEQGDVLSAADPTAVGRAIVAMYLGLRQTSNLDEPKSMIGDLEASWLLTLPGFVEPDRLDYLKAFLRRRTALAIRNTAPLADGTL